MRNRIARGNNGGMRGGIKPKTSAAQNNRHEKSAPSVSVVAPVAAAAAAAAVATAPPRRRGGTTTRHKTGGDPRPGGLLKMFTVDCAKLPKPDSVHFIIDELRKSPFEVVEILFQVDLRRFQVVSDANFEGALKSRLEQILKWKDLDVYGFIPDDAGSVGPNLNDYESVIYPKAFLEKAFRALINLRSLQTQRTLESLLETFGWDLQDGCEFFAEILNCTLSCDWSGTTVFLGSHRANSLKTGTELIDELIRKANGPIWTTWASEWSEGMDFLAAGTASGNTTPPSPGDCSYHKQQPGTSSEAPSAEGLVAVTKTAASPAATASFADVAVAIAPAAVPTAPEEPRVHSPIYKAETEGQEDTKQNSDGMFLSQVLHRAAQVPTNRMAHSRPFMSCLGATRAQPAPSMPMREGLLIDIFEEGIDQSEVSKAGSSAAAASAPSTAGGNCGKVIDLLV